MRLAELPESPCSRPLRVGTRKLAVGLFVHRAGGKFKDGLRRRRLACRREGFDTSPPDDQPLMKARRSGLMISACTESMPCGYPG
jgi:hypothetical protein